MEDVDGSGRRYRFLGSGGLHGTDRGHSGAESAGSDPVRAGRCVGHNGAGPVCTGGHPMTAILPAGVRLAVTGPDLTPVRVVAGEWSRTCNLLADSFLGRLPETLVDQLGVFARVGSPISGPSQPDARVTMLLHGMSKIVRHGTGGGTFLIDLS